jgi:hypothetical protein
MMKIDTILRRLRFKKEMKKAVGYFNTWWWFLHDQPCRGQNGEETSRVSLRTIAFKLSPNAEEQRWSDWLGEGIGFGLRKYLTKIKSDFESSIRSNVCRVSQNSVGNVEHRFNELLVEDVVKTESMIVQMNIGNVFVRAKVDTGSALTLINGSVFDEFLAREGKNILLDSIPWLKLRSASGNSLSVRGMMRHTASLVSTVDRTRVNVKLKFIVVDNLATDCLFGFQDACRKKIAALFADHVLVFTSQSPVVAIGLEGCQRSPMDTVRDLGARLLDSRMPRRVVGSCESSVERRTEIPLWNSGGSWRDCFEVSSRIEVLDFSPPLFEEYEIERERLARI